MALVCAIRNGDTDVPLCCSQESTLVIILSLFVCIFALSSKGYVALSRKLYYFLSTLFKSSTAVEQVIVLETFQALLAKTLTFPLGTCPCVNVWEEPQVCIWNLIQGRLESELDGDI